MGLMWAGELEFRWGTNSRRGGFKAHAAPCNAQSNTWNWVLIYKCNQAYQLCSSWLWMLLCCQIDFILRKTDAFCQLCGWNLLDWSDWDCWPVDSQCPHHKPRQIFVEPENKYLCWGARSFVDKDDKHLSQTYFRSVEAVCWERKDNK